MKFRNLKKYAAAIPAGMVALVPPSAMAQLTGLAAEAEGALQGAQTDAIGVGTALLGLAVIVGLAALFVSMVKRH